MLAESASDMVLENKILSETFEARRWPYYLIIPLTWLLILLVFIKRGWHAMFRCEDEIELLLFDGIGRYGKVIKKNAAGWKAVDLIYNHQFGEDKTLGGRLDDFWFNNLNCQAARNRFRLAKQELQKALFSFKNCDEIKVLSFAAGTGQIECEAMAAVKKHNINIKCLLVDKEIDALRRAAELIAFYSLQAEIDTAVADVSHMLNQTIPFQPHIINMITLIDYLDRDEAIRCVSRIYGILPAGGIFITSNTMPNVEMHFVKWVVGWPLIYRKPSDMSDILVKSGFVNHRILKEPLRIQSITVAQK